MRVLRIHWPMVAGRLRTDRGLLLLVGAVVAVTVALTASVAPVTARAADRAMAAAVHDAGPRGQVVATLPEWYDDPSGKTRDPSTATQVRQDADFVRGAMPAALSRVLEPGVTTITTAPLQLLDSGTGRYLQLAFLDTADDGEPRVTYTDGRAPGASRAGRGQPSVEVSVSTEAAEALALRVGDLVPARDEHGRSVDVAISGIFEAVDEDDEAWRVAPQVLHPTSSTSADDPRTAAIALVSADSLPDLRLGVPGDALTRRVVFAADPAAVTWRQAASVEQTIASLQSGAGVGLDETTWDSLLGDVLRDGRAQVAAAQGQARVLLVLLVACALLVLVLAAQLLVRRRAGSLAAERERGAGLAGIAGELVVESVLVTAAGTIVGLGAAGLLAGSVGWAWSVPVVLVALVTPAVLGAGLARDVTARSPANRSARRLRARVVQVRRLGLELVVLGAAALSFVALRQRGVVADGGRTDLTSAGAVTWVSVASALALVRLTPPALRWSLRRSRRGEGAVPLFVAARLARTGSRVLPALVVLVAVCGTTFGAALAATLRDGQRAGALAVVGGDARLDARPDPALDQAADDVSRATGVRAAAAGRIEDGVRVSAQGGSALVRLVALDAVAYERLLRASDLPDAPQLAGLTAATADRLPALVLGGPSGLRDDPSLRWEDTSVALEAVGTAPDVGAAAGPVVVVDSGALAAAGVAAPPDTVWAVGPGAADALDEVAGSVPGATVTSYDDELARRRDAALPSAMADLAGASCVLLPALALLGVALAAAAGAPSRRISLGRLRALGASDRDLRRVLLGELVTPVAVAAAVGLGVGVACAHTTLASLSLERLTAAPEPPAAVVPGWTVLSLVLLVGGAVVLAVLDWRRVRRTPLAELLRT